METAGEAVLLRIFIGDDDTFENQPLADAIVHKAREMELAGATMLRGRLGFGPASRELKIVLRLSEDRPVVIEFIDSAEQINRFIPIVEAMMDSGIMTLQAVTVLRYGAQPRPTPATPPSD